jgi:hypothetical protein
MKWFLQRCNRFLDLPLDPGPRALLVLAAFVILPVAIAPSGGAVWVSFVAGAVALLFLRAAALGKIAHLVDVLVLHVYFLAFVILSGPGGRPVSGLNLASLAAVALILAGAGGLAWRSEMEALREEIRSPE